MKVIKDKRACCGIGDGGRQKDEMNNTRPPYLTKYYTF